ncbi:MAG: Rieske (2Fe-2S) protein [Candidatus Nanopelagicales bacterium]
MSGEDPVPTHDATLSRRALLGGAAGACALLAVGLGEALLADDAEAATGVTRLPDGRVQVQVGKVRALRKVGGSVLLGTVKGVPTAVVRTAKFRYAVLDLRCTHQGTTVRRTSSTWTCPNHGSQFALNGTLRRGPAESALRKVRARLANGVLTVG